jgi:hypothetical protein
MKADFAAAQALVDEASAILSRHNLTLNQDYFA